MFNFYEIYQKLMDFWTQQGAIPIFSHNMYVGAGTFHPKCFFSCLSNQPSAYVYVQKSTRKADARYGESPNRLLNHHQLQVIFTPETQNMQTLLLQSLEHIGIDPKYNFIQFNDNNWENISIGATGVGWEVLCNNTEICQFTYFQKMADIEPKLHTVELAYGLERLAFVLWKKSIFDIPWFANQSYKNENFEEEKQFSEYFLKENQIQEGDFFKYQDIIDGLLSKNLYLPAYTKLLEMIDVFNSLDARNLISIVQRKTYIDKTRELSTKIANCYLSNIM